MKSKEERAEISRRNGAKSKGPATPEGKDRSRRNAITHGERAETLKYYLPPHSAVLANEDRQSFFDLVDRHTALYKPVGEIEYAIVRQIVDAAWAIERFEIIQTHAWNRELTRQPELGPSGLPEFEFIETLTGAADNLAANGKTLQLCHRGIDRLTNLIAKCERRLSRIRRDFQSRETKPTTSQSDREYYNCPAPADAVDERTCPAEPQSGPQPVATKQPKPAAGTSTVRQNYPQFFPGGEPRHPSQPDREAKPAVKPPPNDRAA